MSEGAAIGVLLGALAIAVAVETLIGAVFLRAAVALYNKLAGGASSPSNVPEPALGKAMWIIFATSLARLIVASLIGLGIGARATAAGARGQGVDEVALLISFPVSLLIMAEMLSARLPTTFGRAILVTLCYLLVVLLVVGVLVGIAVLVLRLAEVTQPAR
jgi:type III secretory pathway component EscS